MAVDKNGKVLGVPKPVSTKKAKAPKPAKSKTPTKVVNTAAVEKREAERADMIRERNNQNRARGKAAERSVAKLTGGEVVPLSGAAKYSSKNLLMDVQVKDAAKIRDLIAIEVKCTGNITPSGDRSFSMKQSVVKQMLQESAQMDMIGALFIHFVGMRFAEDDLVVQSGGDFIKTVDYARWGATVQRFADEHGLTIQDVMQRLYDSL